LKAVFAGPSWGKAMWDLLLILVLPFVDFHCGWRAFRGLDCDEDEITAVAVLAAMEPIPAAKRPIQGLLARPLPLRYDRE
jgi:hypothetical protein